MKIIFRQKIYKMTQQVACMSIEEFAAKRGKKGMNAAISVGVSATHALVAVSGLEVVGFVAVWRHDQFSNAELIEWKFLEKNNNIGGPIVANLDCILDSRIRELIKENYENFKKLCEEIKGFPRMIGRFSAMPDLVKQVTACVNNIGPYNFRRKINSLSDIIESIRPQTRSEMDRKYCHFNMERRKKNLY